MKLSHALVIALAGFGAISLSAGDPVISAFTSATWTDNITRCPDPVARKNAALYDVAGSTEWRTQASRDVSLHFATDAGLEACPEFDGLNRLQVGARGAVRRKLGLGPYAPVLRADLGYTGSWYKESSRTGTRFNAVLSWSQRWNDNWQTIMAGEYMHNDGHSPAYDYQNRGLSFEARYDFSARWQLAAGVRRQWGDQIFYAWLGGSGAFFPYDYDQWKNTAEDTTFGKNWYAYSMDSTANSGWVSLSCALGANTSLPLRWEEVHVFNYGESYRCRMLSLSLVHRF
ncbi:MAG: hypothetical protein WCR49_07345 [Opitutae bacterium]